MSCAEVRTRAVWEGSSIFLLARIVSAISRSSAVIADFQTAALKVVNQTTGDVTNVPIAAVGNVLFDGLQPWEFDETGHNFRYEAGGGEIADGGVIYAYEFTLTPQPSFGLHPVVMVFQVPTKKLPSS